MGANPLAAINSVALAVGRFASLDEMLDYALRKVLEVVQTEAGGIYLLDEAEGRLKLTVHLGLSERAWRDFDDLPLGEGLSGRVAASGEPIVVRHLKDDPRLTRMAARVEGFCAFASVPLRSNFKTYGTLNIYTRQARQFTEEEVQLLTSMASQIGLSVANARLFLDLKASERRFRGLVENAEDVIYLTDPAGRIVYANPAMARLLGYDPEALCSRSTPIAALVHEADADAFARLLPRMLGGEVMRAVEVRLRHADGVQVVWCSQTSVPLRDEGGRITGIQCIAQDITARRELQAQMARAERLADLGRMAASLAHEIRNPLGAIVNTVRVIRRQSSPADSPLFDMVMEEAQRLETIVRHVLLFARPPARRPVPCDVRELLEHAALLFRGHYEQAEVRVAVAPGLPAVEVDPDQIRQVLWNLLTNAAEAMDGRGRVDLEARPAHDARFVEVVATDDGPGLADAAAVLEPFYTTKAQGTGLGLAIVHRIVRDHGGYVHPGNAPPRGARIVVGLPVAAAGAPRRGAAAASAAAGGAGVSAGEAFRAGGQP
jgi:two-component system, sporulation sensor kinase E